METPTNFWTSWTRQVDAGSWCANILARPERYFTPECFDFLIITFIELNTGKATPAGKVRNIFGKQTCRRAAINDAFSLANVHSKIITLSLEITWPQLNHFLSELYKAEDVQRRVCLELSCSAGAMCRCSECVCCSSCTGECGCLAASRDFQFILQQLLIEEPCSSYR